jgi:hypothetical protein
MVYTGSNQQYAEYPCRNIFNCSHKKKPALAGFSLFILTFRIMHSEHLQQYLLHRLLLH